MPGPSCPWYCGSVDVVQASQLVESVGWAETLAIWKRKIQMLKEISGVNEAPSPVPFRGLSLRPGTDTWSEVFK